MLPIRRHSVGRRQNNLVWRHLCLLAFCVLVSGVEEFPHISDIEIEFYQTEVTVTDIEQQVVAFAKEYYDGTENRGRVEITEFGDIRNVFYYEETGEILEVKGSNCKAWLTDESIYGIQEMFYGWLTVSPNLVIGPSALLWSANETRDQITYSGVFYARGIRCDTFLLNVKDPKYEEDINVTYYFAEKDWATPYQFRDLRVPVRITVSGQSSRNVKDHVAAVSIDLIYEFAYFRPMVDESSFQPPIGVGCPLRKPTMSLPKIPKEFQFYAESFDVFRAQNEADDAEIKSLMVAFDGVNKMARLDLYSMGSYFNELYDFNTGVMYKLSNEETCEIKVLRSSRKSFFFFESEDGKMTWRFRKPEEVLGLNPEFYYIGKDYIRGLKCDVFEYAKKDVTYMDKKLDKFVTTVYFTDEFIEVFVNGEEESQIPVNYIITGYDDKNKMVLREQYNIFAFDDELYPPIYESLDLDRCFPSLQDKSYFMLIMETSPQLAALMEGSDRDTIETLREKICENTNVSPMRIPLLRADYKVEGIFVTGLMLDRPPAIKQFIFFLKTDVPSHDKSLKSSETAETKEECAFECVNANGFNCLQFYMCGKECHLSSKDLMDKADANVTYNFHKECDVYFKAEKDSNNKEEYLGEALMKLQDAVMKRKISVKFQIPDQKDDEKITVPVVDVIIGDGPITGNNQEKSYNQVIKFAKLKDTDKTSAVDYIGSLQECYDACKKSEALSCASFSYCPTAEQKQCKLSSVLFVDRKQNPDGFVEDKDCFVYSLKYIEFFEPFPGTLVALNGDEAVQVTSKEECAKRCRETDKFTCRGFEYCTHTKESSCTLHSKHLLDLKEGEKTKTEKKSRCTHYAAKFTADYFDKGLTIIDDNSNKRSELSLEECARICSEDMPSCKSFNYCPNPFKSDSTCFLLSKTLGDKGVKTKISDKCHHYTKKEGMNDWAMPKEVKQLKVGYTAKSFTGLVIGMLALGVIVGALAFVGYSYMRKRRDDTEMTVRFVKQKDTM